MLAGEWVGEANEGEDASLKGNLILFQAINNSFNFCTDCESMIRLEKSKERLIFIILIHHFILQMAMKRCRHDAGKDNGFSVKITMIYIHEGMMVEQIIFM